MNTIEEDIPDDFKEFIIVQNIYTGILENVVKEPIVTGSMLSYFIMYTKISTKLFSLCK